MMTSSTTIRFDVVNYTKFRKMVKELEEDPLSVQNIRGLQQIPCSDDAGYEVPNAIWINNAIDLGIIELRKDSDPLKRRDVIGGYEVFLNEDGLGWVKAHDGSLEYGKMGEYVCSYCGTSQKIIYGETKKNILKPKICANNNCGKKDNFKLTSPTYLQRPVWLLPGKPIECTDAYIFEQLIDFFKQHLVLKDYEYDVLALWAMASWLVDDFRTCPYLALIAPKSSGKTQVLEAIRQTAYRAYTTSSVTSAALFRSIELWNLTLCIDEAQDLITSNTETGQAIYACLLSGYKRGTSALRAGDKTNGFTPESFDLFGFKAFSGTKLVLDTLESRSIAFDMQKAKPKKIMMDEDRAMELRSMLLWYRFTHLHKLKLLMPHDCESGRLIELFTPLYTVEHGLDCKESLDFMIDKMLNRDKEDEKNSIEAEIMNAIAAVMDKPAKGTLGDRTLVFVDELVTELGWERGRKNSTILGKKLKVMGIPSKHTNNGNGIDIENPTVLANVKKLMIRYSTTE